VEVVELGLVMYRGGGQRRWRGSLREGKRKGMDGWCEKENQDTNT